MTKGSFILHNLFPFLILLSTNLGATPQDQANVPGAIRVKAERSFGARFGQNVLLIGGIAEDSEGNLFVADKLDCSVKKFGSDGTYMGKYGAYGKGKGEFKGPLDVAIWKDRVAIVDYLSTAVNVISTDLKYVRTVPAPNFVVDIAFDRNGRLYVATATDKPDELLTVYDSLGNFIRPIRSPGMHNNMLLNSMRLAVTPTNNLLAMYQYFNTLEEYDPDGNLVQTYSVPNVPSASPQRPHGADFALPAGELLYDLSCDNRGRIWILSGDFSTNANRDVYILSANGLLLQTLTLPKPAGTVVYTRTDCILVREEKRTVLTRYKVLNGKKDSGRAHE